MKLHILVLSLFSVLFFSCGAKKSAATDVNNDQTITDKYWKLITLEGQPVEMAENQERETYFILKANDNTVAGFAGCNNFTGSFTIEKGNRIRFQSMGLTLRMCPDVEVNEMKFVEVFELVDNYTIHNDTLELNIGRRAPLARFVAVYF